MPRKRAFFILHPSSFILLALLVALWPVPARAQQPASLDASIDRDQVTVGDRMTVTLVLRLPEGAQPDLTGIDRQFGELDPIFIGLPEERTLPDGMREIRVRFEVAAFRPGSLELPALTIPFQAADGTPGAVTSTPHPITVQSVLLPDKDPGDVRDLKPQIDLPYSSGISRRTAAVAAVAVAVLALASVAALRWWLRRRGAASIAPLPVLSESGPDGEARAELDRVAGLGLLDIGDLRSFHALIAACIRRYLSDRYGFPAFAMTTSELAARMEREGVNRWPARLIAGLLGECDAVSYAGYQPALARAGANLSMAYEIVELTRAGAAPVAAGAMIDER